MWSASSQTLQRSLCSARYARVLKNIFRSHFCES
nr:MAG TPA: hypothetical protein [Caudoviricetes sp.]